MSTLDVISYRSERLRVFALTGYRWAEGLAAQCAQFAPERTVVTDAEHVVRLETLLKAQNSGTRVLHGVQALIDTVSVDEVDNVMCTIVNAAGLPSALVAAQKGRTIYLANKETLVVFDALFMETIRTSNARALPVDSRHNAIFQVLPHNYTGRPNGHGIRSIILTAFGGPLPDTDLAGFGHITPARTVRHPNWSMGRKVPVDSATMMNKGLELIETHWLFSCPPGNLEVVIHPQSVVYSVVRYLDGSALAQLGNPDVRMPIAYCLGLSEQTELGMDVLNFGALSVLIFRRLDFGRPPCLKLAYDTMYAGGSAPCVLDAANEVTVATFLDGKIRFTDIARVVTHCLDADFSDGLNDIESLLALDAQAHVRA